MEHFWRRVYGSKDAKSTISACPLPKLSNWLEWVNQPLTEKELAAIRQCAKRGNPHATESGIEKNVRNLCLESSLPSRGRPKKKDR